MLANFHITNRRSLIEALDGGVIVMSGYGSMQRSSDASFYFEQEANFWWLTGIESPDWWVIIDGARSKSWLVAPTVSTSQQIFDGSLDGDAAQVTSGVDGVIGYDEALRILQDMARRHSLVYSLGEQPHAQYLEFTLNPAPKKLYDLLERTFGSVQDCRKDVSQLRAIKQPVEIAAIKKAIKLTAASFASIKQQLATFTYEYEVEAEFSYLFRRSGSVGHAYDPIVAVGYNACTLHYVANNSRLKNQQLLLLDIGARVSGYAADITRTYAIGTPTKRQTQVHAAVQAAHRQVIALLRPGLSVADYSKQVEVIMTQQLMALGLMADAHDQDAYQTYFPHAISHGLGIDVHDSLGGATHLQPGMVLTVEPGIYIPEESIGIRIEDDILITETGHSNLSAALSTDL